MNKSTLILGAGSSISNELIDILLTDKQRITAQYRSRKISKKNIEVIFFDFNTENVDQFVDKLDEKTFDSIVVLLGETDYCYYSNLEKYHWEKLYTSNVIIPNLIIKSLISHLNIHASIVFIGSEITNLGQIGMTHYIAAKSALKGIVKSLPKELKHKKIRVNLIEPHLINSDNTSKISNKDKESYIQSNLSGRIGESKDLAYLIAFLISEKSSYINAETIHLNGGYNY